MRNAPPRLPRSAVLATLLSLAACTETRTYIVDAAALAELRALSPAARAKTLIPAQRVTPPNAKVTKDNSGPAQVKAAALVSGRELSSDGGRVVIETRARNRLLEAGHALTWIGSAISIAGTALFLPNVLRRTPEEEQRFLIGGPIALGAEPIMWAGTALWVLGTMRPPQEGPMPRVRYDAALKPKAPDGASP